MRVALGIRGQILLTGFRSLLASMPSVEVVASGRPGGSIVRMCGSRRPDVVLTDAPITDFASDRSPEARELMARTVLLVGDSPDDDVLLSAAEYGIGAIASKNESFDGILRAIEEVNGGRRWVGSALGGQLLRLSVRRHAKAESGGVLSRREQQVLTLVAAGKSNDQIADDLVVAVRTVKYHLSNALSKLGAQNRAHAVAIAIKAGHLPEP
jgi:DNA-binding NarL/FixJ family response regulator